MFCFFRYFSFTFLGISLTLARHTYLQKHCFSPHSFSTVAVFLSFMWSLTRILIPVFLLRTQCILTSVLLYFFHFVWSLKSFTLSNKLGHNGILLGSFCPFLLKGTCFYFEPTSAVTTFPLWQVAENRFYQKSFPKPQTVIRVRGHEIPGHLEVTLTPRSKGKKKGKGMG